MNTHAIRQYEEELAQIRDRLMTMGTRVGQMIEDSVDALVHRSSEEAQRVVQTDLEVNRDEVELDEQCLHTIALRAPAASDLRFLTLALKIVTDLERIGDLAVNISERILQLVDLPAIPIRAQITEMAGLAVQQLQNALHSFIDRDAELAGTVIEGDGQIDQLYEDFFRTMVRSQQEHSEQLEQLLGQLFVGKYLERVGDHATNIAEMVVFMVKGKDIRHLAARLE